MSQRGVLGPKEVPMLGGVPNRCPYNLVPFCSAPLPHYRSGVLDEQLRFSKRAVLHKTCSYQKSYSLRTKNCSKKNYYATNKRVRK